MASPYSLSRWSPGPDSSFAGGRGGGKNPESESKNVAVQATSNERTSGPKRLTDQRLGRRSVRRRRTQSRIVFRRCLSDAFFPGFGRATRLCAWTCQRRPPKVRLPRRYLWERPPFSWRRRRSNRPRKLSGKRTAGGWVSGKWRAPHLAHAHRRSKPNRTRRIFQVSGQRGSRTAQSLRRQSRLCGGLVDRSSRRPSQAHAPL